MKTFIKNTIYSVATCALLFSLQGCGKDRAGMSVQEAKDKGLINPNSLPGQATLNCGQGTNDTDCDYLPNDEETRLGTDPNDKDTDKDGIIDGCEAGVSELAKYNTCGKTDPKDSDSDNDGLEDGEELKGFNVDPFGARTTDPNNPDSDKDGILDGDEVGNIQGKPCNKIKLNGCTLTDESSYITDPRDDDTDGDGLDDGDEIKNIGAEDKSNYITDPTKKDTDGDMLTDGVEVLEAKTNPELGQEDTDKDGVNDGIEVCGTRQHIQNINGGRIDETDSGLSIIDSGLHNDKLSKLIELNNLNDCSMTNDTKNDAQIKTNDSDGDGRTNIDEYNHQPQTDPLHPGACSSITYITNDNDRQCVNDDIKNKNAYYPWIVQTDDGQKMVDAGFVYVPRAEDKNGKQGFWMSKYVAVKDGTDTVKFVKGTTTNDNIDTVELSTAKSWVENSDSNLPMQITLPTLENFRELFDAKKSTNSDCLTIENTATIGDTNMPLGATAEVCELLSKDTNVKNQEFKQNGKVYINTNSLDGDSSNTDSGAHFRAATDYVK